jgi:hypothetical protein
VSSPPRALPSLTQPCSAETSMPSGRGPIPEGGLKPLRVYSRRQPTLPLQRPQDQEQPSRGVVASAPSLDQTCRQQKSGGPPTLTSLPELADAEANVADSREAPSVQHTPQAPSKREEFITKIIACIAPLLPVKIQHRRAKALPQGQTPRRSRRIAGAEVEFRL